MPKGKNKSPKLSDLPLSEVGQMFVSLPEDPTPGAELIDSTKLDFSVGSLLLVDEHIAKMKKRKLEGDALVTFVLRCGAYVGEVMRRNSKKIVYHWLDYKDAAKISPLVRSWGEGLDSAAVLWDGQTGFTFPMAKVIKCLVNGPQDSVHFLVKARLGLAD